MWPNHRNVHSAEVTNGSQVSGIGPGTDEHTWQAKDAFVINATGQIVDAMLSGKVMNVCEDDSKTKMSDGAQRHTKRWARHCMETAFQWQDTRLFMKRKMIPCYRGWIAEWTGRRRSTHVDSFFFPKPSGFAALPNDNGSHSRPNLAHTTNAAMSTPQKSGSQRQSKHQQLSAKEKNGKEKCGTCRRRCNGWPAVRDPGPCGRFASNLLDRVMVFGQPWGLLVWIVFIFCIFFNCPSSSGVGIYGLGAMCGLLGF